MKQKAKLALRRWYYHRGRFINGGRGVISLFLAILMVPFVTIAGSLINAARVNSAIAIFDEALCNASNSTLGTYDEFLRKRFGLLAMKQTLGDEISSDDVKEGLSATFNFYMKENMKVLSNTYTSYESDITGVYPLADENVLMYQVLEYSKYSVPTKLLEDTISLDSLIAELESCILGTNGKNALAILTSGAGVADATISMGEAFDVMKTETEALETMFSTYEAAYGTFEAAVTNYLDTEKEMQEALDELDESEEDYAEQYAELEEEYQNKLKDIIGQIDAAKQAYSAAIDALVTQLPKVETALDKLKEKIVAMDSSLVNMAGTAIDTTLSATSEDIKNNIGKLKDKKKENPNDETLQKNLDKQIVSLEDQKTELGNVKQTAKAQKKAYDAAMSQIKEGIQNFDNTLYTTATNNLKDLKGVVDSYDSQNVTTALNKGTYYKAINGLLTKQQLIEAEKHMVEEVTKSSILALVKAVIAFFDALLKIEVLDPELTSVIDMDYYKTSYGGLPSQKDRTVYPLATENKEDEKLSEQYKKLYGNYSASDAVANYSLDIFQCISNIGTEFGNIKGKFDGFENIANTILTFGKALKDIFDSIKNIVSNLCSIVQYVGNMISGSGLVQKTLLTGYAHYMLSDRTTYKTDTALTGAKFTLRGQDSEVGDVPILGGLEAIFSALATAPGKGDDKCFYGAEKEYLIFGSSSEIYNQMAAFLMIYGVRLICNIPMLFNTDVNAIATASTVFAPIIYLCYIIIEPFIDTILIVNNSSVNLIKTYAYLTPGGVDELFTSITSMGLNNAQLDKAKKKVLDEFSASGAKVSDATYKKSEQSLLQMDYSKMLFLVLLIGVPQERLLNRMSDIIEMEAAENATNGGSGGFDLDYSYTYMRAEASFTMNEFIPLSNAQNGLKSKKRIVYRGY